MAKRRPSGDGMVRKRLDIQLSLWEKAKDVIATGELID